ncbi:hypothetical protein K3E25_002887 [Escherichia coli]|nr:MULTISPECIES: hypothetical protein [Enterobacteriaceae]EFZ0086462.1 hypothetical protein [Shigella flexneri]ELJ1060615.1 hypothetical protein [Escherichia coli O168]ELO0357074.1 hypothetical protein [Escherichia coli O157]DAZ39915.1 MAG TPA: hypothetical protein [Caudoviricetes sp.]HEB1374604.1 hypothetical protein [Escherichia albertii]
MSNNWIYVGANINDHQWSKVGKTTRGLQNRHVSSQNPGFFIYTAYNIIDGDVHEIESNLLVYLESQPGVKRIRHLSTGSKSECFSVHPEEVACLVESFINNHYPSCVTHEFLFDGISRYQCPKDLYNNFNRHQKPDEKLPSWCEEPSTHLPNNLNMSSEKYFTSNQVEHEADLGNGYFVDYLTGLQGYRDEDGNEIYDEPK